jgi:hypothetical protein
LLDLVEKAEPIGWGYGDDVRDTVAALEHRRERLNSLSREKE